MWLPTNIHVVLGMKVCCQSWWQVHLLLLTGAMAANRRKASPNEFRVNPPLPSSYVWEAENNPTVVYYQISLKDHLGNLQQTSSVWETAPISAEHPGPWVSCLAVLATHVTVPCPHWNVSIYIPHTLYSEHTCRKGTHGLPVLVPNVVFMLFNGSRQAFDIGSILLTATWAWSLNQNYGFG